MAGKKVTTEIQLLTKDETDFRIRTATDLAEIKGKIDTLHAKLEPLNHLQTMVTKHDRQIHIWQGANSVIGAIVTLAVGVYLKIKHYF